MNRNYKYSSQVLTDKIKITISGKGEQDTNRFITTVKIQRAREEDGVCSFKLNSCCLKKKKLSVIFSTKCQGPT